MSAKIVYLKLGMLVKMMEKKWEIYLLECSNGNFYTGITNDISKRIKMHASGKGSKYVRANGFSKILARKNCKDKSDALKQEYYVKQLSKEEKINYFK